MLEQEILDIIPGIFAQGRDVLVGPGDDCAVIDLGLDKLFLMASDQVAQNIHYPHDSPPEQIARKLIRRNISDIAAMGGAPAHALLSASIVPDNSGQWFRDFLDAIAHEARSWNISVCGGDICRAGSNADNFSLAITGWVARNCLCTRSGAKDGDLIFATGQFGNSFLSGHHFSFSPRLQEAQFLAGSFSRAMIDVSDGLLIDALRFSKASAAGISLNINSIPMREGADASRALRDGEDYELLAAVPKELAQALLKQWPFNTPITHIGSFSKNIPPGHVIDSNSTENINIIPHESTSPGFDHFDKP